MFINVFVGAFNIGLSRSEYLDFNIQNGNWSLLMKMGGVFSLSNTNTSNMKIMILLLIDDSDIKD